LHIEDQELHLKKIIKTFLLTAYVGL
jgi:hypothetical protein